MPQNAPWRAQMAKAERALFNWTIHYTSDGRQRCLPLPYADFVRGREWFQAWVNEGKRELERRKAERRKR